LAGTPPTIENGSTSFVTTEQLRDLFMPPVLTHSLKMALFTVFPSGQVKKSLRSIIRDMD
jgi:hypothetical protein